MTSGAPLAADVGSASDLERIAELSDPVLRNLLITQRYHDISQRLCTLVGDANVNWCTFATWASKTAGQSIRGDEVPRLVRELIDARGPLDRLIHRLGVRWLPGPHVDPLDLGRTIMARVSSAIAEGNLKVFHELAPIFMRAAEAFGHDGERRPEVIDAFVATLRPGASADGGQEPLRRAFRAYYDARFEPSPKRRAELVLFANCLIGLHEQTRLQPNIVEALDAPIDELIGGGPTPDPRSRGPLLAWWDAVRDAAAARIAKPWRHAATHLLMRLTLPHGTSLSLGEDVPDEAAGEAFPRELEVLEEPDVRDLVAHYDPDLASNRGSAAHDWGNLDQRMGFIVTLFRSRQQDTQLLAQPFSDAQHTAIEQGNVPAGPL